jgi:hypothetical protein
LGDDPLDLGEGTARAENLSFYDATGSTAAA